MTDPQTFLLIQFGAVIRDAVPTWLIPVFLFITRLGNVALFLGLFTLDYWYGDRERGSHAISIAIAGMALIVTLKWLFDLARPPESVNVIPIGGYAFPSGHAMGSTIAYGLLAYDLEIGTWRKRLVGASVIVFLISLSRVVLGVHFVRDVVAGVAFGVAFLVVAISVTGHNPRPGYWLSVGIGLLAVIVSGASHDGLSVLGAAIGALLVWETLDYVPSVEARYNQVVLVAVVLPILAGIGYVSTRPWLALPLVFLSNAVLTAGILVAPVLLERFDEAGPGLRTRSDSDTN